MSAVGQRIAKAIVRDLMERMGFRSIWIELDVAVQNEITEAWALTADREIARKVDDEAAAQAAEVEVRAVLLSNGAVLLFRSDAEYRVAGPIGDPRVPSSFRAHELADAYEDRAESMRHAIEALR